MKRHLAFAAAGLALSAAGAIAQEASVDLGDTSAVTRNLTLPAVPGVSKPSRRISRASRAGSDSLRGS